MATAAVIVLFVVLSVVGIIGSIVPGLPGHPLNFLAFWLVDWYFDLFSTAALVVAGLLALLVFVLDYYIPLWTANRYGATKSGIRGSIIGMIAGTFFSPIGMIVGTLVGAVIGDLIAGRKAGEATKSGIGTLWGTLLSIGFKFFYAAAIGLYASVELVKFLWRH